jgi:SET domain
MEAHGGLYVLHSHLNHSCTPNVSVRHITRNQTPRITVIAKSAIPEGEELVVSYVDPSQDVWTRRRMLKEWGFGTCLCERCVREAESGKAAGQGVEQKAELEDELRGFLGV